VTTLPTDALVLDATEAEARRVMARRCRLKQIPSTHGEQAELAAEVDALLDQWLALQASGATA
jgi:hypothetical protein